MNTDHPGRTPSGAGLEQAARPYEIRKLLSNDVRAVAGLVAEFAKYMEDLGDTRGLKLDADSLERHGFGPHPAFEGLVAEVHGEVVGFSLYHDGFDTDAASRVLFIVDLFVLKRVRKLGIGTALIQSVCEIGRSRGAEQLVWTVDKHNAAAVQFYQGLNGRIVDWLHLMYMDL